MNRSGFITPWVSDKSWGREFFPPKMPGAAPHIYGNGRSVVHFAGGCKSATVPTEISFPFAVPVLSIAFHRDVRCGFSGARPPCQPPPKHGRKQVGRPGRGYGPHGPGE